MKKVLFVLALVAAYGVSMAMSTSNVINVDNQQAVIIAEMDNNDVTPEGEKEKEKKGAKKATAAKGDAKAEGCASSKTAAKADGCSSSKTAAKAEGCASSKTAKAKSGCSSSCGGSSTAQK